MYLQSLMLQMTLKCEKTKNNKMLKNLELNKNYIVKIIH